MIIRSVCMLIVISLVCVFGGDSNSDSIHDANFSTLQLQLMLDKISNCSEEIGLRTRQLQQCFLIKQNGSSSDQLTQSRTKPSQSEVWGLGLLFVTAISLCSLLGVSVLPLTQKAFYKQLLTALIGLAVGSLTSSSLFHLIPQALNLMEEDVGHSYLRISLMMWAGIWLFFMIERIMKVINDERLVLTLVATDLYWSLGQGRGVWCLSGFVVLRSTVKSSKVMHVLPPSLDPERRSQKLSGGTSLHSPESFITNDPNPIYESQEQAIKASFGHQQKPKPCHSSDHVLRFQKGTDSVIATVAWMVIFGDGLHNFIDGLSIGAAFNESILTGISISLAVMCEEFPHELGDFAVLLNAGMTMRQALLYNFMSACTCYLGLFVGIILGEIQASVYIFGFAAGMFLYIALVDMVPEMNEVAEEASKVSISSALFTLLLQNVGMGTGVIVLYLLARYQDCFSFT